MPGGGWLLGTVSNNLLVGEGARFLGQNMEFDWIGFIAFTSTSNFIYLLFFFSKFSRPFIKGCFWD